MAFRDAVRGHNADAPVSLLADGTSASAIPLAAMQSAHDFIWMLEDTTDFIGGHIVAAIERYRITRFPQPPHIAWLGQWLPRDDKLLTRREVDGLLAAELVVEEKLDGTNLGLSLGPDGELRAQNWGQYLIHPLTGQFSRLAPWLAAHRFRLSDALNANLMLFGACCAARHSLDYAGLPD
ncbi:RNA ligase family protein [uncultured Thiodictyon sp.]|uniref:RNA ligase family protein n=1 Tax=uncultured Thiodictyon sp. TaxID=1846217 RepID=UPI0025F0A9F8|nr:RNA ligase family protein [uncultured Thiodictyon sp.]